jgi:hypothetical protein
MIFLDFFFWCVIVVVLEGSKAEAEAEAKNPLQQRERGQCMWRTMLKSDCAQSWINDQLLFCTAV